MAEIILMERTLGRTCLRKKTEVTRVPVAGDRIVYRVDDELILAGVQSVTLYENGITEHPLVTLHPGDRPGIEAHVAAGWTVIEADRFTDRTRSETRRIRLDRRREVGDASRVEVEPDP